MHINDIINTAKQAELLGPTLTMSDPDFLLKIYRLYKEGVLDFRDFDMLADCYECERSLSDKK